jgi:IclR family mhp operon transcriptional activator
MALMESDNHPDSDNQPGSLKRGLRALALINRIGPMTTSQLARELGVPRTTADRICVSLASAGYIERVANGRGYRLTPRVCELSSGFREENWVTHVATPMLFEITRRIGWPLAVAVPVGESMEVRVTSDPATALWLNKRRIGSRIPMMMASSGLIYLAFMPPAERGALLAALRASDDPGQVSARAEDSTAEMLDRVRRDGYCLSPFGGAEHSLSVPIFVNNEIKASLLLMYMKKALDDSAAIREYLPKLKTLAANIGDRVSQILAQPPHERDLSPAA